MDASDALLVSMLFYLKDIYALFLSHKDAFYFAQEPKRFISCLRFSSTSDFCSSPEWLYYFVFGVFVFVCMVNHLINYCA